MRIYQEAWKINGVRLFPFDATLTNQSSLTPTNTRLKNVSGPFIAERKIKYNEDIPPHNSEHDINEAFDILDDLFMSVVDSDGKYVLWLHRFGNIGVFSHKEIYTISLDFTIHYDLLAASVTRYLNSSWMHTPYLDWYCADTLAYSAYITANRMILTPQLGIIKSLSQNMQETSWSIFGNLWVTILFIIKWSIWLFITLFLFEIEKSLGYIFIGITIALLVIKIYGRNKTIKLLNSMLDAYHTFDTKMFSWKVAARNFEDARKIGAKWSGELWSLIEMKGGLA